METRKANKIRVLIVDDSQVSQKLHNHILASDSRFEIVGVAHNGQEAVQGVKLQRPHVVSMDLNMPVMDGMEATRKIMREFPVPIVVVSSLYDPEEQELAMEVLQAGAVTIMPKPVGPGHPDHKRSAKRYLQMLRNMSEVKVVRRRNNNVRVAVREEMIRETFVASELQKDYDLLVIGASAGGPEGMKIILEGLTPSFPIPIMIVQHIDRHFVEGYRNWLRSHTKIPVVTAYDGLSLQPGRACLAPADHHLIVRKEGEAGLLDEAPVGGHRPSVAHLFRSAGEVYGKRLIAVILSGMGNDGAEQMKVLRDMGALTIAQNAQSSLVFGMPGEAVRLGAASHVLTPGEMVTMLLKIFK